MSALIRGPMIFLLLRILFNTAFSQLLKLAQAREGEMLPAALVNYIVAALLSGLGLWIRHAPAPHAVSLWIGAATGFCYAVSMLGFEMAMRLCGVSIAVAVLQLSVLVPTTYSILFFHERPDGWQIAGIGAAMAALPLLSLARATAEPVRAGFREIATMLFLLFFVTGCSGVTMKLFNEYAPHRDFLAYAAILFVVSTIVIAVAVVVKRIPLGRLAVPVGSLVGLSNLLQLRVTLRALALLPAALVFPITSALTVSLNAVLSVHLWNENLNARARTGIAFAILAALLLNS